MTKSLYKYPRTYHHPASPGKTKDDKIIDNLQDFYNFDNVVITTKLDGECTTLYNDYYHARSLDSCHHESRNWVKNFWGNIKYKIPDSIRICGENLFAKHSIFYNDLESYFYGFSAWAGETCLDWGTTCNIFKDISITPVPVLYTGKLNADILLRVTIDIENSNDEGFVVRNYDCFEYSEFKNNVFKYVRENHVQTDNHWMYSEIIPNQLRKQYDPS